MSDKEYKLASAKLALEEMRITMEKKWQASDTLVSNGHQLLVAAGVGLVLAGALPGAPADGFLKVVFLLALALAFLLYIVMLGVVLSVAQPEIYQTAIQADWSVLKTAIMLQEELDAVLQLVMNYTVALPANEEVNRAKARRVRQAMGLLMIIVTLLLFARAAAAIG